MDILRRASRKAFQVIILRPSKYDDEGYVLRYAKGVLPSNTIGALAALTQRVFDSGRFGPGVRTGILPLDDTIQNIRVDRLARRHLGPGRRAVVLLAGVQTNQFPRATDLALRFRAAGFEVMIGGFHVSGAIALSPERMPPEIQLLIDAGVSVVKGEVEDCWGDLLEDAWAGRLQPLYNIEAKPDISDAPLPLINPRYQKRFVYPRMGTIDAGRGCPYRCSFCTIINVQGRKMRCRSPESILRQIDENYRRHRIDYYFFTDDNFARNRHWEDILDGMIRLRESDGIPLSFMMQADTQAWKIPRFVEKAASAGCTQVFLGIESVNEENLKAAAKDQNHPDEMGRMVECYHAAGILCHAGYIIGFPFDSPESVRSDVQRLQDMRFDQCSFFMLTPLPGSEDHARLLREGSPIEPDLNLYDSCHETLRLPRFAPGEWMQSYRDAWRQFASFDYMRQILLETHPSRYWSVFKNFMWYRNAMREGIHPMIAGLWRRKDRTDRRPGCAIEGRRAHLAARVREAATTLRGLFAQAVELQDLWLQTRVPPGAEPGFLRGVRQCWGDHLGQWGGSIQSQVQGATASLGERGATVRDWLQTSASDASQQIRQGYADLQTRRRNLQGALAIRWLSRLILWWDRRTPPHPRFTRVRLNAYWRRLLAWTRRARLFRLSFETPRIAVNLLREVRLWAAFTVCFFNELTTE